MNPAPAPVNGSDSSRTWMTAALLVAVTFAIYAGSLHAGFVGDDFMILHRLRALAAPGDVLRFFRGEFFEYYRPLPFVLHAVDWSIAGADARQFHLTNVLLHATNAVLVLLIGRELAPRSIAGPVAAMLFALHASNHEAAVWMSARFDLLATCFALAAILVMVRGRGGARVAAPVLFLGALLSKESAVALPAAAAGFAVFRLQASTEETVRRLVPWLLALALYSGVRHLAGGVSAIGGAARLPKLVAFLILLAALLLLAGDRWVRVRDWLRPRRALVIGALALGLASAAVAAAAGGRLGQFVAEKLAVAGFAIVHLVSPFIDLFDAPFYLDSQRVMYWLGGVIALSAAGAVVALLWRPLLDDDRMWFLGAFLAATLLPISALTEGARYLYLPSAAASLMAGIFVAGRRGTARTVAYGVVAIVLVVSAAQIRLKVRDWVWAGSMTAEGARLVDAALAPACGNGHVVFLTGPVAIRGVYTHSYYETFEIPRGCMPAEFQVLVRVMRLDTTVDVKWDGPRRIVITAPAYRDNFVLSEDLRHFDLPLRGTAAATVQTPLGELQAERIGGAERLTLTLRADAHPERTAFFYYSDARIQPLPPRDAGGK
jgi:hypothetical protein